MRKIAVLLLFSLASIIAVSQTNIHYWDFNTGASATTGMKWPSPITATSTANYGSITHTFDNTDNFSGSTLDASGFTSSIAGESFSVVSSNNNTKSFIINASTLGFKDILLTYATRGTAAGFTTHTIDYSVDGTNYTNVTTISGRNVTSFSLQTVSFIAIAAANNNPNFKIRITLDGATSTSGNNRFDNIRVAGTAAPCSPTNQPTALILTPSFNTINGSFTAAVPGLINASAYLVIMSTSASLSSQPANGQVYNADDIISNGIVISVSGSTSFTTGSLTPGTTYYFFVYSYDNATNCYHLVSPLTGNTATTTPPACTAPSLQATGLAASNVTGNSMDISYTRGNGDKIMIIARAGSSVTQAPFNSVSYSTGTQIGTGNYVIYNGTATSFSYTSLSPNTTYFFALYEYNDAGICYNQVPLTGSFTTACVTPANVSSFVVSAGNGLATLTWANPSSTLCFDQILVVASTASISGLGSDYTGAANSGYSSGTQVVYRATGNTVTITGLTNNTTYFFKVFTRLGVLWSAGVELTGQPFDPSSGFQYLFGNIHAHSSYSDGNKENTSKTPKDDFEFARDANCMDFLGMSEHNHSGAGMSYSDYLTGYNQAQLLNGVTSPLTGNSIVTLWGMEWGVISNGGHVLIYGFDDKLIGWEAGNYDNFVAKNDYSTLWTTINNRSGAFATLAHPNTSDYNGLVSGYNTVAASAVVGSAIESGPAFSVSTTYNDFPSSLGDLGYFKSMLAKGYHIAPQMDHDNHYMTFGTVNTNRTVLLATAKTRTAVMEAFRARRYYASQDCNARVEFKNNNDPMGSIVTKGGLPSLSLLVTDPDGEVVSDIALWGAPVGDPVPSSPLRSYSNVSNFSFTSGDAANVQPNNSTWYYFVIITQADGNKIVSSPIWYTRSDLALPVTLMSFTGQWSADKTAIHLNWATAREINTAKFIIQRSADNGNTWNNIGTVNANGNSNFNQQYAFRDLYPSSKNWYRLKIVDIDGEYSYSKVVILTTEKAEAAYYTLYPNPARNFINVTTTSGQYRKAAIQLLDNTGRVLTTQSFVLNNTSPAIISVSHYKTGLYYLVITDEQQSVKQKIIIADK
ncbi:MAG: T9SS type A sorting domain-containing protein [Chitinophagaceae bacterium]|nr:T9SS type A sorting domain-containing protein [Chitinophagaceae bacterium]